MPAAVEVSGFEAAFAGRGEPAWHNLGTVFDQDEEIDTLGMLDLAHLSNWDVRLIELPDLAGVPGDRHAGTFKAVVRTNPFDGENDVLAVVGARYEVFQNEEIMAFAQDVIGSLGRWETMGSLSDGRKVFGSLKVPDEIVLDPEGRADVIRQYLLGVSSHDGSKALSVLNTPVRVVCQNTLNVALSGAKMSYSIKHTTNMNSKLQIARVVLDRKQAYMDKFSEAANAMIERELTNAEFDKIVAGVFPAPDKDAAKAAVTRHGNKVDLINSIYAGSASGPNTTENIHGTAWGALNALTEAVDWYRKPRKGNAESVLTAASGLDPVTNGDKNKIFEIVQDFVAA